MLPPVFPVFFDLTLGVCLGGRHLGRGSGSGGGGRVILSQDTQGQSEEDECHDEEHSAELHDRCVCVSVERSGRLSLLLLLLLPVA
jgi:hypothetical protein